MAKPYTLSCRKPPHVSEELVDQFTEYASRHRHSTRWQGGYWEASWSFIPTDENRLTAGFLRDWFENRLMFRIEERSGGIISWQGVVWTMVLTLDGVREERSVGDVFNAVRVMFVDPTGTNDQTDYILNQRSIDRYGRRDLVLEKESANTAQAEALANTELIRSAEAWSKITGINPDWPNQLDVIAVGDVFLLNNRLTTAPGGVDYDARITQLLTDKSEFVTAGGIKANSLETEDLQIPTGVWEVFHDLVKDGDGTQPWRLWVDADSRLWYQPADNTPAYEYHGRVKGLSDTEGNKSPWLVKPGVVRNVTRQSTTPIPGSFLSDGRDSWVQEVEMANGWSEPSLKPAGVAPEDIQDKAEMYQMWLEREAE